MTSKISPWAARLVGVNADGTFSAEFVRWLNRQLVQRAGGALAMTNVELADAVAALAVGEQVLQPVVYQSMLPDIAQPASAGGADLADITQTASAVGHGEITWQT